MRLSLPGLLLLLTALACAHTSPETRMEEDTKATVVSNAEPPLSEIEGEPPVALPEDMPEEVASEEAMPAAKKCTGLGESARDPDCQPPPRPAASAASTLPCSLVPSPGRQPSASAMKQICDRAKFDLNCLNGDIAVHVLQRGGWGAGPWSFGVQGCDRTVSYLMSNNTLIRN